LGVDLYIHGWCEHCHTKKGILITS
jgi:hypothetical protein